MLFMWTSDFDYDLPIERIAQQPLAERSNARMMVVHRGDGQLEHRAVRDLGRYLRAGDAIVFNDTRVIPARLFGRKDSTGGRVEILLIEEVDPGTWDAFFHASGRPRPGAGVVLASGKVRAEVLDVRGGGRVRLRLNHDRPLLEILDEEGVAPLPPYIKRGHPSSDGFADAPEAGRAPASDREKDRSRYQTVYARIPGAVAAPTAGLHFTPEMIKECRDMGVQEAYVTLHVGPGTFRPVGSARVEDHLMDSERFWITEDAASLVNRCRESGGRVLAVGSTSARVLESSAVGEGRVQAQAGRTSLFIYPPFRFRLVDRLLTNFHLPRSTLLMMVSAFAGRELILNAYNEAIRREYRFYSYGDCMLIL